LKSGITAKNMQIKIKVEGDVKEEKMTFSDDFLENRNYIEMWIEGKIYLVLKEDLIKIVKTF